MNTKNRQMKTFTWRTESGKIQSTTGFSASESLNQVSSQQTWDGDGLNTVEIKLPEGKWVRWTFMGSFPLKKG